MCYLINLFLLRFVFSISILAEPIYEDLDLPHRYRPENLQLLCDATG